MRRAAGSLFATTCATTHRVPGGHQAENGISAVLGAIGVIGADGGLVTVRARRA
jgi:hypothetical protein